MRSHARIEVERRPDGATAVVRMLDSDQIGVRLTTRPAPGAATGVHLIGTAAGPLGGDEMRVDVRVGPGARLVVRGSAATIALPGGAATAGAAGRYSVGLEVADGGELEFAPEPTVVCAGADLIARTRVEVRGSGRVRLDERVVLGRHGEPGGAWSGRLEVLRDDLPVLRTTLTARQLLDAAPGTRAVLTLIDTGPSGDASAEGARSARAATSGRAVATPLAAGGLLVTAFGPGLIAALADRDRAHAEATAVPDAVT